MTTMKAVRQATFGAPDVLTLDELPMPQPKPEEVLIRVRAASINHFDILSRRGDFPDIPLPRIVGMDCSGYVEQYNGTRTDLAVGQPVVVLGNLCLHQSRRSISSAKWFRFNGGYLLGNDLFDGLVCFS